MSEFLNLVEMIADDEECAFDQPCKYGHRVEGHAVYCHNNEWRDAPRKCRRSWYWGEYKPEQENSDYQCPGFAINPEFKPREAT